MLKVKIDSNHCIGAVFHDKNLFGISRKSDRVQGSQIIDDLKTIEKLESWSDKLTNKDQIESKLKTIDRRNFQQNQPLAHNEYDLSSSSPKKELISVNTDLWNFLQRMAHHANTAYCSPINKIGKVVRGAVVNAKIDTQTNTIIVYFKGLELTWNQWFQRKLSLTSYKQNNTSGMVDSDWISEVNKMMPGLCKEIKNLLQLEPINNLEVKRIDMVGHGIGGAYAVLSALALEKSVSWDKTLLDSIMVRVITFGQPRLGLSSFANQVNQKLTVFRVTHTSDYVPQVAQSNYRHHDMEYWISKIGCDCDQFSYEYQLYRCPRVYDYSSPTLKLSDNNECNFGQSGSQEERIAAHWGPYFGVTINDCKNN
ncbi:hypothetical protein G9A89_004269 [Geosiphon pyriformis]|nr:hypothetical protein G9A89_004269 [Geosiphon pyriformis]